MYRFGPFAVDFAKGVLQKNGERVRIQEQPLRVLEALLERPGELVTREEIRNRLWPSDTFVDFERSSNAAVAKLRQALNDSADHALYIETEAKKGYRFIAPVVTEVTAVEGAARVASSSEMTQKKSAARWVLPCMVLASAVALLLWVGKEPNRGTVSGLIRLDLATGGEVRKPAITRDGTRTAFVLNGRLAMRGLSDTAIQSFEGTEGATYPFFSPDGNWIAYFSQRKLKKISVQGGMPVTLCDAQFGGGGVWGEDGTIIAALTTSGGLSKVPASGGTPQPLTNISQETTESTNHRSPELLPQGKGLLYVASHGTAEGELRASDVSGGRPKVLVQRAVWGKYVPTGHLLYVQGGTLFAARFDLEDFEIGASFPIQQGVAQEFFQGADVDVSANGTLVYRLARRKLTRVALLDRGGHQETLDLPPARYITPEISPEGGSVALMAEANGQVDLWMYDFAQKRMTRLTFDAEPKCCPVWTPNSRFIAYHSGGALKVASRDGSVKPAELLRSANAVAWSFSATGRWLTFHRDGRETGTDAWRLPVEWSPAGPSAGEPEPILRLPGIQAAPSLSPDERWMLYATDETGGMELYVSPLTQKGAVGGPKWQVSYRDYHGSPKWSANRREILYRGTDMRVRTVAYSVTGKAFRASLPKNWSDARLADVGIVPSFDIHPEGNKVIGVMEGEVSSQENTLLRVILYLDRELSVRGIGEK